ncbi:MAG: flagellar brake protein [Pseudomonadales bacterium]|nr:flagellar brake protein [Pseudomonadales bacterium]NRA14508.1 flagellar brake protein [Oceanospirillaceae bacterium]
MVLDNKIINEFINQLKPGKVIDLQLGGSSVVRIKPTVIGIDLGRYLLVKFPSKLNPGDYNDLLLSGVGVIVRFILEGLNGECVAFSTTIQQVLSAPNRLIFLNYPTRIENRQLRTHQRKKTHLPAQISQYKSVDRLTGNCIGGYIVDISARGCQFSFKPGNGKSGVKKCPVHIAMTIAGMDEPLIITAHVKNNRLENGHMLVGIMFDESSLTKISVLLDEMAIESE